MLSPSLFIIHLGLLIAVSEISQLEFTFKPISKIAVLKTIKNEKHLKGLSQQDIFAGIWY